MIKLVGKFFIVEDGSVLAEYVLVLSLIVITAAAVVVMLQDSICTLVLNASDTLVTE